jgi:hypothetical protein
MAYFDIQRDLKRRKLVWPASLPQTSEQSFAKKIRVTRDSLKPQPIELEHQVDTLRRQRLFDQDEARSAGGKNSGRIPRILLKHQVLTVQNTDSLPVYGPKINPDATEDLKDEPEIPTDNNSTSSDNVDTTDSPSTDSTDYPTGATDDTDYATDNLEQSIDCNP